MTFLRRGQSQIVSKIYSVPYYLLFGKVVLLISDNSYFNNGDDEQKIVITKTKTDF